MSVVKRWLSQESQVSQCHPRGREACTRAEEEQKNWLNQCVTPASVSENREATFEIVRESAPATPATVATPAPVAWTRRADVITVVEDLADEGKKVGQIARMLGLSRNEVTTILRRTGR
jgi:hypothetical protein